MGRGVAAVVKIAALEAAGDGRAGRRPPTLVPVPALLYTLLRLAIFAVVTAVLWVVGMRSWLAPVAALFVAWALSYVLLARQRRAAAAWVEQRAVARAAARRTTDADEDARYEDAAVDAAEPSLPRSEPEPAAVEDEGRAQPRS